LFRRLLLILVLLLVTRPAAAQQDAQGVAVLGVNGARDDAFSVARAMYVTHLRPRSLDELRARILAGDPAPAGAIKDVRELAELRGSIAGEDAASRRLLGSIAQQLGVQAILVVSEKPAEDADAGTTPSARLFVAETGDFDAARYEPTPGDAPWQATATSISARFPGAPPPPPVLTPAKPLPKPPPDKREDRPFYKSAWLWGALGAAVLIGGIFFFATQDKTDDPIHVRMTVPR